MGQIVRPTPKPKEEFYGKNQSSADKGHQQTHEERRKAGRLFAGESCAIGVASIFGRASEAATTERRAAIVIIPIIEAIMRIMRGF
jgi:hypothetical protein